MNLYNSHITKEDFIRFHNNELSNKELATFLQHIAECTYCADQFAESFEPVLLSAPANLKEQILAKAERQERIQRPLKQISAKKQFFLYSTKVCVAMCGAILLLFMTSFNSLPTIEQPKLEQKVVQMKLEEKQKKSYISSINNSLDNFTSKLNNQMNLIVSPKETN